MAVFDGTALRVRSQSLVGSPPGEPSRLRIEFDADRRPAGQTWVVCGFATAPGAPPDLVSLDTPDGSLSEPRLFALNRFWLTTEEAANADPMRAERAGRLPSVPMPLAYALQQLLSALPNAAIYSVLAAAYSLVYGLFGRINLAFGAIAATGGFAALIGAALTGGTVSPSSLVAGLLLGLWAAALHGMVAERFVLWPLRGATGQQGLVATIGLALFLEEYLRLLGGNQAKWIASTLSEPLGLVRAGDFVVTVTPMALVLAAAAFVASLLVLGLLGFTGFGRSWRATADDAGAAALFGVDPQALSLKTFALACGLAGLAGAGTTMFYGSIGFVYTTTLGLKALIAAIVGGIGSVSGAFLGGLAIAFVEAAWSAYFPIVYRDLVVDGLLVAILVLRPGGLFGYRDLLPRRV